jgi:tetratricopeptide (TPR) repeat protein
MAEHDPFGWLGATIDGQVAIDAVAGEGAFGVVYRGTHLGLGCPVAVKCLKLPARLNASERSHFLESFRAEARILHRLSKRTTGIVQAMGAGAVTSPLGVWTPYTLMEWLEGESLAADLERRQRDRAGGRSLSDALKLLAPAAEALAVAHEEYVSHRDIKPANLFLEQTTRGPHLKVVDFGIAKAFSEAPSLAHAAAATVGAFRAFTPQYGAPEQFHASHGSTGPWTDVFAFALVFLEVVSGRAALAGRSLVDLERACTDEQRRPCLSALGVSAPAPLDAVVERALEVDPTRRFVSLRELWAALERAMLGPATSFMPPAPGAEPSVAPEATPVTVTPPTRREGIPPEGLVRVCTAVAVEMSASVAAPCGHLGASLEPDEVQEIVERYAATVSTACQRFGALVERVGDDVIAVWGVDRSSDGDPEHAVRAALDARALLGEMGRSAGSGVDVRIGVSSGRLFLSQRPGGGITVRGAALDQARHLARRGEAGDVVMGGATHRQVLGRFELEALVHDGATSYRVIGSANARRALARRDFFGLQVALVGRDAEMQRVGDVLCDVIEGGRGEMLTLVGAPGVGRTRILEEVMTTPLLTDRDATIVGVQASPWLEHEVYGLVRELFRVGLELHEGDDVDVVRLKLGDVLAAAGDGESPRAGETGWSPEGAAADGLGDDIAAAMAEVSALFAPAHHGATDPDPASADEEGTQRRTRLTVSVAAVLAAWARVSPLVLLCDDVQWADDASRMVLEDVVPLLEHAAVAILCASRPELSPRRASFSTGGERVSRLDVPPLRERHVAALVRDCLRRVDDLPDGVVTELCQRADGYPLVVVETIHLMIDAGIIERTSSQRWRLHHDRLSVVPLPAGVEGIVQARLDRLPGKARKLLSCAAVSGRVFWEGLLESLCHASSGGGWNVGELLERLQNGGVIAVRRSATFAGEREYFFCERTVQEVAYGLLGARARRELHGIVAQWLEGRATTTHLAVVGQHYEAAGDPARASEALVRAGVHSASLGQNDEAIRLLERAQQLHDQPAGALPWPRRVQLGLELGDAYRRVGRYDEAERSYRAATDSIPMAAGDDQREVGSWRARGAGRLALLCKIRGDFDEALVLVRRAVTLASDAGAVEDTPPMHALAALLCRRQGRDADAWAHALAGLRALRALDRKKPSTRKATARLLLGIGSIFFGRSRFVAAERSYLQASRVLAGGGGLHLMGAALNGVAAARGGRGDHEGARTILMKSLTLKERAGDVHQLAVTHNNLAQVELRLGHAASAVTHARRSVALGEKAAAQSDLAAFYDNLAEALMAAGQAREALAVARRALDVAATTGRVYLAEVAESVARLCASASAPEAVESDEGFAGELEATVARLWRSLDEDLTTPELLAAAQRCKTILGALAPTT